MGKESILYECDKAKKTREMLAKIAERVCPVSAYLKPIHNYSIWVSDGIPEEVIRNTISYETWEDVLTIFRALGLEKEA